MTCANDQPIFFLQSQDIYYATRNIIGDMLKTILSKDSTLFTSAHAMTVK